MVCFAPKARHSCQSLGQRPRIMKTKTRALKARFMSVACFSIPDIPLVEIDPVLMQQLAILLLKSASAMVLLLRVNVSQHGLQLTRAH